LHKITDLGDFWEKETGKPIPLGGIAAKRSIETVIKLRVDKLINESIKYAFKNHYNVLSPYVKEHAQEMSEEVMRKHINLYVNDYSIDISNDGKMAVSELLNIKQNINNSNLFTINEIFLNSTNCKQT
jgi:1,4-dihydroxy-6-naphthoate synthase